jgi:hypothetical protein
MLCVAGVPIQHSENGSLSTTLSVLSCTAGSDLLRGFESVSFVNRYGLLLNHSDPECIAECLGITVNFVFGYLTFSFDHPIDVRI